MTIHYFAFLASFHPFHLRFSTDSYEDKVRHVASIVTVDNAVDVACVVAVAYVGNVATAVYQC